MELKAYRAGGVKEHLRLSGMDVIPFANVVEGANEAPGKQTVYVRDYIGREPTLLIATTLALEALGGTLSEPIPEEIRREFGRRVSMKELRWRLRKNGTIQFLKLAGVLVLLPILLPVFVVPLVWKLIVYCARSFFSKQDFGSSRRRGMGGNVEDADSG